jgi:hypothetical protein
MPPRVFDASAIRDKLEALVHDIGGLISWKLGTGGSY